MMMRATLGVRELDEIRHVIGNAVAVLVIGSVAFILVVTLVSVLMYVVGAPQHYEKMMAECLADGHKEYECVGILRGRR